MTRCKAPDAPVFLVGFIGVGKTTVGRALAARLGWAFTDTDAMVEQSQGRTIEEIFTTFGEGRFREIEWNALRSLTGKTRVVVATGGGLFLGVAQRAYVRAHGISCWLDAPLETVTARVVDASARPLWPTGDALSRRAFFERRRAAYALADCRVDAKAGEADDLARAVQSAWSAVWR